MSMSQALLAKSVAPTALGLGSLSEPLIPKADVKNNVGDEEEGKEDQTSLSFLGVIIGSVMLGAAG